VTLGFWQRVLLGLVVITIIGLIPELVLLEHYEEWQQLIPLVLLGLALISTLWLWFLPRRAVLNLFRSVMMLCLASAGLGLYFHYQANVEFVLERHSDYHGWQLFQAAMTGAMPALAPGTMAQLALIGLAATLRPRSAAGRAPDARP
jgi:hypothetical protein